MKIIDSHHHLWCPENDTAGIGYVWLKNIGAMKPFGDPTPIQRDYLPEEFKVESSKHEIIGSVHVQCDGAIPDPVQESVWLESLKQSHDVPSVHIGFVDLTSPETPALLERYIQLPNFRGVRQIISRIADRPEISFTSVDYLDHKLWREQFALLAEHNLSFDLQLYPEQMSAAAAFFKQHPDIPVVIDHAGSPYDQTKAGLLAWREGLAELSQLEHCHIKLSGFGMFDQQWTAQSIQPLFNDIVELFSAERVMFGSNFPVDKLMRSYDFVVDSILECCGNSDLSTEQLNAIFSENAKRFYRLGSASLD